MNRKTKKQTGSYYTCIAVADVIAAWAMEAGADILEPAFGDGSFVDALFNRGARVTGIEIQQEPYDICMKKHADLNGVLCDFFDYEHAPAFDAVVGNPPYVSLRKLDMASRKKALDYMQSHNIEMSSGGSMWMPFVVHGTELLRNGGRLGFVLPYELSYVRYAFPLWNYLSDNYSRIRFIRIVRDFFPDVDVETVLFLAEDKGGQTRMVDYEIYETLDDLIAGKQRKATGVCIDDILDMSKPFEKELIPAPAAKLLDDMRARKVYGPLVPDCKFNIGYVSGNKEFFQVDRKTIKRYGISEDNVRPSLLNAKQANRAPGIETSAIKDHDMLFYPVNMGLGEQKYIKHGKKNNVDKAYKCRVRKPWYIVPGLSCPSVVLTVFGDIPKLLRNDGNMYVSNSLLCGFCESADTAREIVCRWYNSLTLLSIETVVHSLGGGTLVLIPGETDKIETVSGFPADRIDDVYGKLCEYAKTHTAAELYEFGDELVLKGVYSLSDDDVLKIRDACETLRSMRMPEGRRLTTD